MLSYVNGSLHVDGVSIRDTAAGFETPFFLFSATRLLANCGALAEGLAEAGAPWRIRYCAKSNNEPALLRRLAAQGAHVLVSHAAEAELARACGFEPGRIAFQKPALVESEVRAVLETGVRHVHILRPEGVDILAKCAEGIPAGLRVSLRLCNNRGLSPLARAAARLGMSPAEALVTATRMASTPGLNLHGLHFYIGTQQRAVNAFIPLIRRCLDLTLRLRDRFNVVIEEIDIGGGIPSPTLVRGVCRGLWRRWRHDADPPDLPDPVESLRAFTAALARVYVKTAHQAGLATLPTLTVEPGRAVAGNAGILIAQVRAVQGRWVYLDASRNSLPESPLLFCRRVLPVTLPENSTRRYQHLCGPTLNTTDILDFGRRLPPLQRGDLVVLGDAGVYSLVRASRYAGLTPAAYLLDGRRTPQLIRRAEQLTDLVATTQEVRHD